MPCPLVSRVHWLMWWVSPWGAEDLATGPDDTSVGQLFRAQSPVDLFSRAKPAATARGLEVSVSRSGPPQPTDSEQQGWLWGCRTPLLGEALKQKHLNHITITQRGENGKQFQFLPAYKTEWDFIYVTQFRQDRTRFSKAHCIWLLASTKVCLSFWNLFSEKASDAIQEPWWLVSQMNALFVRIMFNQKHTKSYH